MEKNHLRLFGIIFTSLFFCFVSCIQDPPAQNNQQSGEFDVSNIGYGPYTSSDGYLTVEATDSGILIKKTNPEIHDHVRIEINKIDSTTGNTLDYLYFRPCFTSDNDKDEFTYKYVSADSYYSIFLITYGPNWECGYNTETLTVKAKNGTGDAYRTFVYSSYVSNTKTASFKVNTIIPNELNEYYVPSQYIPFLPRIFINGTEITDFAKTYSEDYSTFYINFSETSEDYSSNGFIFHLENEFEIDDLLLISEIWKEINVN